MLYRTVIIEDDSVITHLNRRYVEMDNRFCVVQTFSAAHPALFWLRSNPVDLIILDVYMPQMSGLDLLRALRGRRGRRRYHGNFRRRRHHHRSLHASRCNRLSN